MSSIVSFSQFIRHGGQASIVLSLRAAAPALALKQSPLDNTAADAFEQRLRELAAENWSVLTGAFARAGIVADPTAKDVETELSRCVQIFRHRLQRSWQPLTRVLLKPMFRHFLIGSRVVSLPRSTNGASDGWA